MSPSPASFAHLLELILPVFALVGVGVVLRRIGWIAGEAERSLVRLVVSVCYPCLTFDAVFGNPALSQPGNLLVPPLAGFGLTVLGIATAATIGRLLGLGVGTGLRTFSVSAGIANYAYLPIPIIAALWGARATGVLFIHNVGVDAAVWTVAVVILDGARPKSRSGGQADASVLGDLPGDGVGRADSPKPAWLRVLNPVVLALLLALVLNWIGLAPLVAGAAASTVAAGPLSGSVAHSGSEAAQVLLGLPIRLIHSLAVCAVPLGLTMTGVTLAEFLARPAQLLQVRVAVAACAVRVGLMPLIILGAAVLLPVSADLKRVLIVQAAMPSGVIAIILARHYGGQPLTAVRIVLATTAVALLTCPFWIRAGLAWAGV